MDGLCWSHVPEMEAQTCFDTRQEGRKAFCWRFNQTTDGDPLLQEHPGELQKLYC